MKFIIDENLSPDLVSLFESNDLYAVHVNSMKAKRKQRIIDDQLRRLTLQKEYIMVTKDDDFVKSFVDRKVPEKLIYIFGLETKVLLLERMLEVIPQLSRLIDGHDFIEINQKEIRFPFSD